MKTLTKKIEIILSQEFNGHPSREDEDRIDKLEKVVMELAKAIDNLRYYNS